MPATDERSAYLEEYNVLVQLLQDTGQTVWLINTGYLLATTVLLGGLGTVLGAAASSTTSVSVRTVGLLQAGAAVGVALCLLWRGAFERAYAFYNLRIHYARGLERRLGFSVHELGQTLSKTGTTTVKVPPRDDGSGAEDYPISVALWLGRNVSSQAWSRLLMLLFGLVFIAIAVEAYFL